MGRRQRAAVDQTVTEVQCLEQLDKQMTACLNFIRSGTRNQ